MRFKIKANGTIIGAGIPDGLLASVIDPEDMLTCVAKQRRDERITKICARLNHADIFNCVMAECAFLRGLGGGCQSPVGAHAEITGTKISLRAVSFRDDSIKRGAAKRPVAEAALLGEAMAAAMK